MDSDQTERAALEETVRRHETELARSQGRLDVLYEDRLDGRIDAATYDWRAEGIREQQAQIRRTIEDTDARMVQVHQERVDLAALTMQAGELFVKQSAAEQRKLLHLLVKEAAWKAGALQVTLREPFAASDSAQNEVSRDGALAFETDLR